MDHQFKLPNKESRSDETVRLILCGDLMLGRLVNKAIFKYGPGYPLGKVSDTLKKADLTLVNLESAITSSTSKWPGEPKAFYFGAAPEAIESLLQAGIDGVSLANNHTLDLARPASLRQLISLSGIKLNMQGRDPT